MYSCCPPMLVGKLLNNINWTQLFLPQHTLPNPATDFLDLSLVLPPCDETLSLELSLTGICCLTSGFSPPFASLLVLIRFKLDTEDPEPDSPEFAGWPEKEKSRYILCANKFQKTYFIGVPWAARYSKLTGWKRKMFLKRDTSVTNVNLLQNGLVPWRNIFWQCMEIWRVLGVLNVYMQQVKLSTWSAMF